MAKPTVHRVLELYLFWIILVVNVFHKNLQGKFLVKEQVLGDFLWNRLICTRLVVLFRKIMYCILSRVER